MRPLKVGELAKRTGLSVRTLHYYDEIRLLWPSYRTAAGHRLYTAGDIARLQQIQSLRQLGFSLAEIRDCLDDPDFSPNHVIELHIARLREQMALQQRLCARLEAMAAALGSAEEISVETFLQTVKEINIMEKYFTPEQVKEIKERGQRLGQEHIRQVEAEWPELIRQVRAEMEQGTDPASERVQHLARRWMALVHEFTGGNPGIEQALRTKYQQEPELRRQTGLDPKICEYISQAIAASQKAE